jgi:hypothetical protein
MNPEKVRLAEGVLTTPVEKFRLSGDEDDQAAIARRQVLHDLALADALDKPVDFDALESQFGREPLEQLLEDLETMEVISPNEPRNIQITPKGVGVLAGLLFREGWLDAETLQRVGESLEHWDWREPVCQQAFQSMKPASKAAMEARGRQVDELRQRLGRPLTDDEFDSLKIVKGPLADENEAQMREWEWEQGQPETQQVTEGMA